MQTVASFHSSPGRVCWPRALVENEAFWHSKYVVFESMNTGKTDASSPQRSFGELASYQQKMYRIDDHVGIAIAGLTSDARVLRCVCAYCALLNVPPTVACSNFMRQQAMSSRMLFNRPAPVNRLVGSIADSRLHSSPLFMASLTLRLQRHR